MSMNRKIIMINHFQTCFKIAELADALLSKNKNIYTLGKTWNSKGLRLDYTLKCCPKIHYFC